MQNYFYLEMDAKLNNIIIAKVSSDWKRFARGTGFSGVNAVVDQIDHDHDVTKKESKIETFLEKLYQQHPIDYRTCIQNSLIGMGRNDVLQDISSMGVFILLFIQMNRNWKKIQSFVKIKKFS